MEDAASVAGTERVAIRMREHDAVDMEIDGERGVNLENELAAADGLGEAFDLTPSMMASRATCMFTEGNGKPRGSEEPAIATKPTLWLVKLAKEAVSELFVHHRDEVQQSWGEPLDQEEALGYLVCDALGCELVPDEARGGRRVPAAGAAGRRLLALDADAHARPAGGRAPTPHGTQAPPRSMHCARRTHRR